MSHRKVNNKGLVLINLDELDNVTINGKQTNMVVKTKQGFRINNMGGNNLDVDYLLKPIAGIRSLYIEAIPFIELK